MKTIKDILREAKCPNPKATAEEIKEHVLKLIDKMPNYLHKKDLIDRQKLKQKIQG